MLSPPRQALQVGPAPTRSRQKTCLEGKEAGQRPVGLVISVNEDHGRQRRIPYDSPGSRIVNEYVLYK